ncbi:MAG: UDP-N-acetylglucosamine 2-epimerase (non-hydrolyzing) [Halobacteriota archaeon]
MKIASIIGARPNFIKAAPVSIEIRKEFEEILIHTGQHYDYEMDRVFFEELNIPEPDYHLGVGSGSQGYQTGEMIKRVEDILMKSNPDLVLVYGDTNTTLAGAIAASKLHIKVGHVEAGLRSYDKAMPEEINRILTDHCSDLLFCPTETAIRNLKKEGITKGIYLTGDVMVDALLRNKEIAEESKIIEELGLKSKQYLLATIHRQNNTDDKGNLSNIVAALCDIGGEIVFPVHPRARKYLRLYGFYERLKEPVKFIKPLGYFDFLKLMSQAKKVLTDSGGVQKEAYILKVPCITLRETTEWIETVEDGWNVLVGADRGKIVEMATMFEPKGKQRNVFGDGRASKRVVEVIRKIMQKSY